jgi:hypothetical protein
MRDRLFNSCFFFVKKSKISLRGLLSDNHWIYIRGLWHQVWTSKAESLLFSPVIFPSFFFIPSSSVSILRLVYSSPFYSIRCLPLHICICFILFIIIFFSVGRYVWWYQRRYRAVTQQRHSDTSELISPLP